MDKRMAKMEMLKELSKVLSDDQFSDLKGDLDKKKMSKVTVMSDSPQGLKKGLSKAEQLLKLKGYGSEEKEMESEEECPECEGEGCEACEESEEGEEKEMDLDSMSPEEMKKMIMMMKSKK